MAKKFKKSQKRFKNFVKKNSKFEFGTTRNGTNAATVEILTLPKNWLLKICAKITVYL